AAPSAIACSWQRASRSMRSMSPRKAPRQDETPLAQLASIPCGCAHLEGVYLTGPYALCGLIAWRSATYRYGGPGSAQIRCGLRAEDRRPNALRYVHDTGSEPEATSWRFADLNSNAQETADSVADLVWMRAHRIVPSVIDTDDGQIVN